LSQHRVVFDSSAMLAFFKRESGFEKVQELLNDEDIVVYAHAVNLAEVFYDFGPSSESQNRRAAEEAIAILKGLGVIERNDMDTDFWRDIAFLISERRAQPPRPEKPREKPKLALGDAFGIALSRRLGCEFVTADKTEVEPLQSAGMCRAEFIR